MAKLTSEEIAGLKIIRTTFEGNKWIVLVSDENGYIYRAMFEGLENDENSSIITKTKNYLLDVEKFVPTILPTPLVREDIVGSTLGETEK